MKSFTEAREQHPELMQELICLEYVLTWNYTETFKKDEARYLEIAKIIYS